MNSFSQADVAKRCNVTRATVSRWVELAKEKKNNLELDMSNKIVRVLDLPNNDLELNRLATEAKKYRNSIPLKEVLVSEDFYSFFSEEEAIEIITNLEFKKKSNLKYSYKGIGASYWNEIYKSNISPIRKTTLELIENLFNDIKYILGNANGINVIDIGPGNSEPVISFLKDINKQKLLSKYIAVDISQEMLDIAKKTVELEIPTTDIKTYVADIEYSRLNKIFFENKSFELNIHNLILFIGNTIVNFEDQVNILKNFRSGMTDTDILVLSLSLNSDANKSVLNYIKTYEAGYRQTLVLNKIGIDTINCEVKVVYDESIQCKTKFVILDKDYTLEFKILGKAKTIRLHKDQEIVIWRHYLSSMEDVVAKLNMAGFETLVTRKSHDLSNGLVICKAKIS